MIPSCLDLYAPRAEVLDSVLGDKIDTTSSAVLAKGHGLQHQSLRTALSARHALPPVAKRDTIMEEYNRSPSLFLASIVLFNEQTKHRRLCARARDLRSVVVRPRQYRTWVGVRL